MPSDSQIVGTCPQCQGLRWNCRHNHFASGELTIDSWEHRCLDCGHRLTQAFRSDDADFQASNVDPRICPYCGRRAAE